MRLLSTLIFAVLLAGCASAPAPPAGPERTLYIDNAFKAPANMITPEQVFELTPEMKAYAANVRRTHGTRDLHHALFDALYNRDQLMLEYDSEMTRTAAQAFEARSGNCMSLVIMTAAFARELGLSVQFQRLTATDTWSRSGSLYFSSGHVNLMIGKINFEQNAFDDAHYLIVDFLPPPDAEQMPTAYISERRIVAMFYANRAAEAIVQGKLDDAYWWSRAAIEHDPSYLVAYNTLATVYERHGDMALAERTLRYAHQYDPENTVILFNLAEVTDALGKKQESAQFKADLARLEPYPPFYFFNLGQEAMARGDYRQARKMFVREVQRAPYYHEFHFWLAKADLELGDLKEAEKHMNLALVNSTTRGDSAIYASKLANLRLHDSKARLRQEGVL